MRFAFYRLRFRFEAQGPIRFPPGAAANTLRGAFGSIFRSLACAPDCPGTRTCERRSGCAYARIFEPGAIRGSPSGLANWPRPFVFRASHLDGCEIQPGEQFHFGLNLFALRDPAIEHFALTFAQLADQGLGRGRGRAVLLGVDQLDEQGVVTAQLSDRPLAPTVLSLEPGQQLVTRVRVCFLTPTELKSGRRIAPSPDFGILVARARDRISTLRGLYGDGPLPVDFAALGERAAAVRMTHCELRMVESRRRSTRTDQIHPLSGFAGVADYEGNLAEFLPYLRAAAFTGVGRQTTWGKGEIAVYSW